ncbi:amidohydrolase family protein [Desulfovibrio sp. OttesenSCG-928-G15]|nr:amidohydrolase family protein [Desulfovibrio sp. OttesenSCG-928-G15]
MGYSFVIKGDICFSKNARELLCLPSGYAVCVNGRSEGAFAELPQQYAALPLHDYSGKLVIPGLVDLHAHAPQYAFRGFGMDLELLEWLAQRTFPEEAKYAELAYAERAYALFVDALRRGPSTRACIFATRHVPATELLMDLLEASGLVSFVGKVNMDRNSYAGLQEKDAETSAAETLAWLERTRGAYANTAPILTPRFIPSCSDDLLQRLAVLRKEHRLPLQSHLSENRSETAWVRELCPTASGYADAYRRYGMLGQDGPTIMAHCVWLEEEESAMLREEGTFVAHCPQSNMNLSSGIAPARRYLDAGLKMGLGSDMAGGCHLSIFRAMTDAVQVSKLRNCLVAPEDAPLTLEEAFYLGTVGGGAFFAEAGSGFCGSFAPGCEFDALVLGEENLASPFALNLSERLARVIYYSDDSHIKAKFVRGNCLFDDLAGRTV